MLGRAMLTLEDVRVQRLADVEEMEWHCPFRCFVGTAAGGVVGEYAVLEKGFRADFGYGRRMVRHRRGGGPSHLSAPNSRYKRLQDRLGRKAATRLINIRAREILAERALAKMQATERQETV